MSTLISPEFAAAFIKASGEIRGAVKDSTNPHFKSKYADLESVIEAVKPHLISNGMMFVQSIIPGEDVEVTTVIIYQTGESLSLGSLKVPLPKKDAQGYGSALTYARRYSLSTALGIPSVDDDGEAAKTPAAKKPPHFIYMIDGEISEAQSAFFKKHGVWQDAPGVFISPVHLGPRMDKFLAKEA